ncbi:bifunctional DNA primase/polymerase [Dietzia cercidiphylli]
MLEHALKYAADGLEVFPLVPRTKRPATAHGKDDATADADQIRAWWTATPDANIAARPPAGVVVLDVDPRHGGTLDALGDLPPTYRTKTGGGGWHVWAWLPEGLADRVRGKLDGAEGIDVKTSSGYLVMPPSVHPDGGRYVLEDDTEPADLPAHLLDRVVRRPVVRERPAVAPRINGDERGGRYWAAALTAELDAVAGAPEGSRNDTLNRAAYNLGTLVVAVGADPNDVADQLATAARGIGLDDHEAQATIRSGLTAGMESPRDIPDTSGSSGSTGLSGSSGRGTAPDMSGSTGSTGSSGSIEGVTVDRTEPILDEVRDWLARYVRTTSPGDLDILALWAVHTHFMGQLYTTPRLLLDSPMPEAGKTTVVEHFARLCFSPSQASALSSAALLARMVRSEPRTLLIDEADRNLDPKRDGVGDLLSVINTGYKRGGTRPVLVPVKDGWEVQEMSTYSPVLMAGISPNLPDDTRSRCIRVVLMRDHDDTVEESDWEAIEDDADQLAARIAAWAEVVADEVAVNRPPLPEGIKGRARERWSPLKRIATVAGGRWPATVDELATTEAEELKTEREEGHVQKRPALALIDHIAEVWKPWESFVGSEDLVRRLIIAHPEVWGAESSYGRALTVQRMGRMLSSAYKVHTTRQPTDDRTRGYTARSLDAATSGLGLPPLGEPDEPVEPVEPDGGCPDA